MTNMIAAGDLILKTDTKGRVRTPRERRESLLDEFERSGLSGTKFAELAGIKYQTFAAWAARRRKQRGQTTVPAKRADSVRWLEAVVQQTQAASHQTGVSVRLPSGVCIEVGDVGQVRLAAALVEALAKPAAAC
jgi:hypothetical protein